MFYTTLNISIELFNLNMRCQGYTKKGDRCKRTTKGTFCSSHTEYIEYTFDMYKKELLDHVVNNTKEDDYNFWKHTLTGGIEFDKFKELNKVRSDYLYLFKDVPLVDNANDLFDQMKVIAQNTVGFVTNESEKSFSILNFMIDITSIVCLNDSYKEFHYFKHDIKILRRLLKGKGLLKIKWEEKNMNKLRIKELCKCPRIADDLCKYVISQYL